MDDPETWRWIWLAAVVFFGVGEMSTPGSFFLGPFAVGAAVAAVLAFLGVDSIWQWTAFVAISLAALFALRPLARRLDQNAESNGVGSRRLIGRVGVVLEAIPFDDSGVVRIDREDWRAVGVARAALAEGARVRVVEVEGTKVVVTAAEEPTNG